MGTTKAELLERVEAVLPDIAANARQAESDRRPHDQSIEALIDCGIMQTLVPARFGGHELGLDALGDIVRAVSSACVSTGWITAFYIGHNWMLTKFSEAVQKEVFADRPFGLIPIQPSPNVDIKEVDGGHVISGRSNFSSGIMNADWVVISIAGHKGARSFVVRREDVEVEDVWFMSGMSATGSNDVLVEDLFVPEYRSIPTAALFNGVDSIHDNPIYGIPLLAFIYCEVMGVYCGGLRGATAAYEKIMRDKIMTWGGDELAQKQAVHIKLGEAQARLHAADTLYEQLVADTTAKAVGCGFNLETRLEHKARAGLINQIVREGVNDMMSKVGTRAFRLESPIQRFFRDLNTLSSHAFVDVDVCFEQYGRHRLGLEPNHPLI